MILKEGRNINMDKDYAETYKEYKSGKYKYTKGFGKLGCYQGLDYIENILKNDKYYSEDLEDSFIFIQSYIKCIEQQVKKQKEVIDKVNKLINHYLKNTDESGSYVETNTGWKLIPEILKELEDILKEVSE